MWIRGVKYAFVTAIGAAVDVAQHMCASQGWGPPDTDRGAILILGKHGVLTAESAESMGRAAGFCLASGIVSQDSSHTWAPGR